MTESLLLKCCECGRERYVPFTHLTRDALTKNFASDGWFLSVITPQGEPGVVMAPLCDECAEKVYPPELLKAARKAMR